MSKSFSWHFVHYFFGLWWQSQQQESDTHPSKRNTQLSSSSSHSYKHYNLTAKFQEMNRDTCNGATISGDGAEFQYIQRILKRTGIDKSTPLSLAKWYSDSHPLDPSIFHHFELFHLPIFTTPNSTLTLRCNRKLIFQLVDELLVEILKPYFSFKSRQRCQMNGKELIDTLCMRIRSFPSANCQVLEDIDWQRFAKNRAWNIKWSISRTSGKHSKWNWTWHYRRTNAWNGVQSNGVREKNEKG